MIRLKYTVSYMNPTEDYLCTFPRTIGRSPTDGADP